MIFAYKANKFTKYISSNDTNEKLKYLYEREKVLDKLRLGDVDRVKKK